MIELFPDGFEEIEHGDGVELVAYTDASGEERLWHAFGAARGAEVQDGWEDAWRSFHKPIRIEQLWVGPPWEQPDSDAIPVVIDPARAFGTGSHPTTRLCLELLVGLPRGSLLDVGCGSGVLSIAAAKLGFGPVRAFDVEDAAVDATRTNAAANGVEVTVERADALTSELPAAEVAVSNIALEAVGLIGRRLDARWLITSGYLQVDEPEFPGRRHVERRRSEGWAADLYERATD
jgi:ribosomal protein L11 methyltransferase